MSREKWFSERQLRDIGRFVSYMKGVHGMDGKYFAQVVEVSTSTLSEYENGKRNLSPEKALKLVMAATTNADETKVNALIASIPRLSQEVRFNQLIEGLNLQDRLFDKGKALWIAEQLGWPYQYVQRRLSKHRTSLL